MPFKLDAGYFQIKPDAFSDLREHDRLAREPATGIPGKHSQRGSMSTLLSLTLNQQPSAFEALHQFLTMLPKDP